MAKPVLDGQVMLINPCRLCKGEAAGTFARVFVPTGEAAAAPLSAKDTQKTDAPGSSAEEVKMEDTKDGTNAAISDQDQADKPAEPAASAAVLRDSTEQAMECDIQVEIVRV